MAKAKADTSPQQETKRAGLSKAGFEKFMNIVNNSGITTATRLAGTAALWPIEKRIPTGSVGLDLALGMGGWPRGRIIEMFGQESSGKTTMMLHAVREAQKLGMYTIYIDAENSLDPNYATALGVDVESMLVNQPDNLQQAIDLMTHLMKQREKLDNDILIVVDSVAALVPAQIADGSAFDETMALRARIWSTNLPKLNPLAAKTNTTLFLVNQMRESVNAYTKADTPGGKAIKFNASARVEIRRSTKGHNNTDGTGLDGQDCTCTVVKNKMGSPFKVAEFFLRAGKGVDPKGDILAALKKSGVVMADTKIEADGTVVKNKKSNYSLLLDDELIAAMREDERATWIAATGSDEDFEFSREGQQFISVFGWPKMLAAIEPYDSAVALMRGRILDSLNEGEEGIDPDAHNKVDPAEFSHLLDESDEDSDDE